MIDADWPPESSSFRREKCWYTDPGQYLSGDWHARDMGHEAVGWVAEGRDVWVWLHCPSHSSGECESQSDARAELIARHARYAESCEDDDGQDH